MTTELVMQKIREFFFVRNMARRINERSGMAWSDSKKYARDAFSSYREDMLPYEEFDWSKAGAYDLADTDMSYWSY